MNIRSIMVAAVVASGAAVVLGACAARPAEAPVAQPSAGPTPVGSVAANSILVNSSPAAGSTVPGPVNTIKLTFSPPARLNELTVNGPDGLMPMMVTAIGEVADYSVPVAGLGPGNYTVNWKAASGGRDYQGSFAFTVK